MLSWKIFILRLRNVVSQIQIGGWSMSLREDLLERANDWQKLVEHKKKTFVLGQSSYDELTYARGVVHGLTKAVEILDSSR
jgi:hypothetical protein